MSSTASKDVGNSGKATESVDLEQQGTPVPCTAVMPKTLGAGVGQFDLKNGGDN
jgi:hypothetical protein